MKPVVPPPLPPPTVPLVETVLVLGLGVLQ